MADNKMMDRSGVRSVNFCLQDDRRRSVIIVVMSLGQKMISLKYRLLACCIAFFFCDVSVAQEQCKSLATAFSAIKSAATNSDRDDLIEQLDLESIVVEQLKSKPHYIGIAGYALVFPGLPVEFESKLPRIQTSIVPHTGCVVEENKTIAQHLDWADSAYDFALRFNLIMYHLESKSDRSLKQRSINLNDVRQYFRISNESWGKLSLESTLLMQHNLIEHFEYEDQLEKLAHKLDALQMKHDALKRKLKPAK